MFVCLLKWSARAGLERRLWFSWSIDNSGADLKALSFSLSIASPASLCLSIFLSFAFR